MPFYYFNAKDRKVYEDEDGVELPDLNAAKKEAIQHFGETLQGNAEDFNDQEVWELTVTDHRGVSLLTLSFALHDRSYNLREN